MVLLVIVVLSYRQTCHAYPNGGGAYAVSRANLGRNAALVAASALLVDYVLTVAVSVAAGVANIVSAVPSLAPHAVALSVALSSLLALMNLRGVKESGSVFAVPTYGFVVCVFADAGARAPCRVVAGNAAGRGVGPIGISAEQHASGLLLLRVGAARLRLRLHRPDRRGGREQRRAQLQETQEPQRRRHAGHHGRR